MVKGLWRGGSEPMVWHVMNRSAHKMGIFGEGADSSQFVGLLRAMCDASGTRVLAFCIMSSHYHVLVRGTGPQLTHCFHEVDRLWAVAFNEPREGKGHVFQGPFLSFPQRTDGWILRTSIYIHLNPVGRLVPRPEDYAWSSCGSYFNAAERAPWVAAGDVLGLLDRDDRVARDIYRRMTSERMNGPDGSFEMEERAGLELVTARELVRWVPVVAGELDIPEDEARHVVCHYGRQCLGLSIAVLAAAFHCGSARNMSMRLLRVGRRLASEPRYVDLVSRTTAILDRST